VGSQPRWIEPLARRLFPHVLRLRALAREHGGEVQLFCAHDPVELGRYQNNSTALVPGGVSSTMNRPV